MAGAYQHKTLSRISTPSPPTYHALHFVALSPLSPIHALYSFSHLSPPLSHPAAQDSFHHAPPSWDNHPALAFATPPELCTRLFKSPSPNPSATSSAFSDSTGAGPESAKSNPGTTCRTPRPESSKSRSFPQVDRRKSSLSSEQKVGQSNIELSRPAVRSNPCGSVYLSHSPLQAGRPRVGFNDLLGGVPPRTLFHPSSSASSLFKLREPPVPTANPRSLVASSTLSSLLSTISRRATYFPQLSATTEARTGLTTHWLPTLQWRAFRHRRADQAPHYPRSACLLLGCGAPAIPCRRAALHTLSLPWLIVRKDLFPYWFVLLQVAERGYAAISHTSIREESIGQRSDGQASSGKPQEIAPSNIELSRPAVRSPAATQFSFPIPRYEPAVPGSASTTCYAYLFSRPAAGRCR